MEKEHGCRKIIWYGIPAYGHVHSNLYLVHGIIILKKPLFSQRLFVTIYNDKCNNPILFIFSTNLQIPPSVF